MFVPRFTSYFVMASALCALALVSATHGGEPSTQAVNKAHQFLNKQATVNDIMSCAHFGATYKGRQYLGTVGVTDRYGNVVPDQFGLVFNYDWECNGAGWTKLGFICDAQGNVQEVVVVNSNGRVQQPFLVADGSIKLVGALVIEACKDKYDNAEIQRARRFVEAADSRGLLGFSLAVKQALGG